MSRIIKKRALLTAAITSLVLVAVAVAFYSTTGTGSGAGGTTDDGYANQLVITGTANAATLVPGGSVPISDGNIHNGNSGSAAHGTISATVDAADADCDDDYFDVTGITPAGSSNVIEAGGDRAFTATLEMEDDTANSQDDCKNTALTINWSSN